MPCNSVKNLSIIISLYAYPAANIKIITHVLFCWTQIKATVFPPSLTEVSYMEKKIEEDGQLDWHWVYFWKTWGPCWRKSIYVIAKSLITDKSQMNCWEEKAGRRKRFENDRISTLTKGNCLRNPSSFTQHSNSPDAHTLKLSAVAKLPREF